MGRFQRDRAGGGQRVTSLELFYDLVFVFAIAQVSHLLLAHLTWAGAGEALLALLVVWWAWNYTTWATNELDPDSTVVRLLLIGVMLTLEGTGVHVPKGYIYFAMAFSLLVEMLNMAVRLRREKQRAVTG